MDWGNVLAVLATIADGILLGAPSNALMADLQQEYNISLAKARQLVDKLSRIKSQNVDDLQKLANKEFDIKSLIAEYPMMGALTESLQRELSVVRESKASLEKADQKVAKDLADAEDELTTLEYSAPSPKHEAQKWIDDNLL